MGRKKQPGVPYIKHEKGYPYYYVTYAKGKRKTLHRLRWEEINGAVPDGLVIRFRDGDTLNCELSNLYLAPRSQFALENRRPETCYANLKIKLQTPEGKAILARRSASIKRAYTEGRIDVVAKTAKGVATKKEGRASDAYYAITLFAFRNTKMARFVLAICPDLVAAQREKIKLINQLNQQTP